MKVIPFVIELKCQSTEDLSGTREQRVAILTKRFDDAKQRLIEKVKALAPDDPDIKITGLGTMFPVFEITAPESVIDELRKDSEVNSVSPAPAMKLCESNH